MHAGHSEGEAMLCSLYTNAANFEQAVESLTVLES